MEARLEPAPHFRGGVKLVMGLFFTAVGILLTADNLNYLDADDYLRFWPVVLILIGLLKLVQPTQSRVVAAIITIVGVGLLGNTLGWVDFSPFDLWPVVLILIGGMLVARALGALPENGAPNIAVFSNRRLVETSQDFRGGHFTAMLGGHELDLTNAGIAESPAIIDAFAFWGGIHIVVPDDWEVVGEVMPVMAGFDVKTSVPAVAGAKKLIVRGTAIMGGIEVKSAARRMS